ncbi:MAG: heavy metal translocating P-type ATPase [Cohaesibacter sp.]|nr:heavy metal translocating P-type ATPase [Cohaesibacter sp.]
MSTTDALHDGNSHKDSLTQDSVEKTYIFDVTGMHCAGCSSRVERVLNAKGGLEASVNLALERADVVVRGAYGADDVKALIEETGFGASLRQGSIAERQQQADALDGMREKEEQRSFRLFVFSLVLTLPLVAPMFVGWFGLDWHVAPWWQLALAAPVQVIVGQRFYIGAFKALRSKGANMDVLVALGTSAAFLFSLYQVLSLGDGAKGHLYFEASAAILTLILFGKWLEGRARRSASDALRALMQLRPQTARLVREGRSDQEVALEQVRSDDLVRIFPGETVPVDGVIVEGKSEFDEALLSGESLPVMREQGGKVVTGAINGVGSVVVRVTALGDDSVLARITRLVDEAQTGRAKLQSLADRVSSIFVPVVVALSVLTFAGWLLLDGSFEQGLVACVSVLVIACPCALGLATPTALVAGTGAAARQGILIRDIDALEAVRKIDQVWFDKTGTLTMGQPALVDLACYADWQKEDILRLVGAVQSQSEHPLAKASVAAAKEVMDPSLSVRDVVAHVGQGVAAQIDDKAVLIGKADFLQQSGIALEEAQGQADQAKIEGHSVSYVALNGVLIALLSFSDPVRPSSKAAISALKGLGLSANMLSGDNSAVAKRVGDALGLDDSKGEMSPHGKLDHLKGLQAKGHHVAMVGDGLNDAPALAQANLGIAMGSGTDVAIGAASITLMRPDPQLVASALDIANKTYAKIWQNLFWAFIYNVIGLPLAAFGFLNPALAGAAMALSSVSVVSNALLLRRWKVTD